MKISLKLFQKEKEINTFSFCTLLHLPNPYCLSPEFHRNRKIVPNRKISVSQLLSSLSPVCLFWPLSFSLSLLFFLFCLVLGLSGSVGQDQKCPGLDSGVLPWRIKEEAFFFRSLLSYLLHPRSGVTERASLVLLVPESQWPPHTCSSFTIQVFQPQSPYVEP